MSTSTSAPARVARTAALLLVFAAAAGMLAASMLGARFLPVLTGSMTPYSPAGSLVLTVPVHGSDVAVGDVVAFRPPAPYEVSGNRPVLHRVHSVGSHPDGREYLITKGDANPAADPWMVSTRGATFGRAVLVVPHLGRLLAGGPVAAGSFALGAAAVVAGLGEVRRARRQRSHVTGGSRPRRGGRRTVHREPGRRWVSVAVVVPRESWGPASGAAQVIRARRALERSADQLGLLLDDTPARGIDRDEDGAVRITLVATARSAQLQALGS